MTPAPTIPAVDGVGKLGIQLLLTAEFMLFSGLVAAYLVLKSGSRGTFHAGAELLHNWPIAAVVALGLASLVAHRASGGHAVVGNLLIAVGMAAVYFVLMAMQWVDLPHPRHGVYSACYFLLSGAVAAHVLASAVATVCVLFRFRPFPTARPQRSADPVQCVAMLWHFAMVAGVVTLLLLHGA